MKIEITLGLGAVLMTTGCYSFTVRHQHSYADYAAVYVVRSLETDRTLSVLKAHLTRDDLNVQTPQGTCRIRPVTMFKEVPPDAARQDIAGTTRFLSLPKEVSHEKVAKAYLFDYYSLERDLYTSAMPQNLLYGCSWGMRGSPRTRVWKRTPRRFKAFVFCDQNDGIVFWSIEKPYELWCPSDAIKADFQEGKLKGWSPNPH